jgi:hypothetical protein
MGESSFGTGIVRVDASFEDVPLARVTLQLKRSLL